VKANWKLVSKEMKLLLTLFAIENVSFCIPLFIMSGKIPNDFKPPYDFSFNIDRSKDLATAVAYALSVVCPFFYMMAPFLQFW
jgi:hypothetical protein